MPRRGRSSPMLGRRPAPAPAPVPRRPMTTAPAHPPPAAATAPRQPGLFGQMAATATGVAVGSVVGHTIGAAMTGSNGGYQQEVTPAPAPVAGYQQQGEQQYTNPCQRELQQFLDCADNQADIALCAGFNEALRQCKIQYGVRP